MTTLDDPQRRPVTHLNALGRVALLYLTVQGISYLLLQQSCSPYVLSEVWLYGALGPLAAVEAIPRFQYHSALSNAGFVILCLTVLALPLAYVVWPRRLTLLVSTVGLAIWYLYGLGFSIHHM